MLELQAVPRKGQNRRLQFPDGLQSRAGPHFGARVRAGDRRALSRRAGVHRQSARLCRPAGQRACPCSSRAGNRNRHQTQGQAARSGACGCALQRRIQTAQRGLQRAACRPRAAANRTTERRQDTGGTYPAGGKPAPHHRGTVADELRVLARDVQGAR